ncbi:hypothetical protein FFI97_009750 [Variovorax sp. KBS0712]|nr:hypothetical protein FFI97_009750 [Variovorax sp. KBS0712]
MEIGARTQPLTAELAPAFGLAAPLGAPGASVRWTMAHPIQFSGAGRLSILKGQGSIDGAPRKHLRLPAVHAAIHLNPG